MSSISYVPIDLAEPKEIVDAVRARRGGTLSNLDRILLHSPNLAQGWNTYLGAVRQRLSIDPKLREIIICCVAVLNDAEYEFHHHAPELLKAGGTQGQVDALRDVTKAASSERLFNEAERAAIQLTLEMTREVKIKPETLARARAALGSDQAIVEAIATGAAYNMVSRMIVACGISPESKH
ncbi:carboxymuconolactone decarboxylase family protein [Paraburkholderia xenovorans]|nr:carboxymuconolactone decarboxylase family protein [Paraburkholderia xenovorans]